MTIGASVRRGIAAGLVAGVLAGVVGLLVGTPAMDAAVELENAAEGDPDVGAQQGFSRAQQKAGFVVGSAIIGVGLGAVFGVAAAWAAGRVAGDAWTRSLKLGAAAAGATVLLPMATYPPNPPGVGDPDTVGLRTILYLGVVAFGLLLAAATWAGAQELARTRLSTATRQVVLAGATLAAAAVTMAVLPAVDGAANVPAELLWDFRLGALLTQLGLVTATAAAYGLLASRAEGRTALGVTTSR